VEFSRRRVSRMDWLDDVDDDEMVEDGDGDASPSSVADAGGMMAKVVAREVMWDSVVRLSRISSSRCRAFFLRAGWMDL